MRPGPRRRPVDASSSRLSRNRPWYSAGLQCPKEPADREYVAQYLFANRPNSTGRLIAEISTVSWVLFRTAVAVMTLVMVVVVTHVSTPGQTALLVNVARPVTNSPTDRLPRTRIHAS